MFGCWGILVCKKKYIYMCLYIFWIIGKPLTFWENTKIWRKKYLKCLKTIYWRKVSNQHSFRIQWWVTLNVFKTLKYLKVFFSNCDKKSISLIFLVLSREKQRRQEFNWCSVRSEKQFVFVLAFAQVPSCFCQFLHKPKRRKPRALRDTNQNSLIQLDNF